MIWLVTGIMSVTWQWTADMGKKELTIAQFSERHKALGGWAKHCENMVMMTNFADSRPMYLRQMEDAIRERHSLEVQYPGFHRATLRTLAAVKPRLALMMSELERSK